MWFQEFPELLEGNYVSRSFPKIYTRSDLYGPTTMATMRRERKTPVSERKIPHTTSDGIRVNPLVLFYNVLRTK